MNNLESRIKLLENRMYVDFDELPGGVFMYVVNARRDAPPSLPVKGWKYNEHQIMRMENEPGEELRQRAMAQVKPFLSKNVVPVFHSINE